MGPVIGGAPVVPMGSGGCSTEGSERGSGWPSVLRNLVLSTMVVSAIVFKIKGYLTACN